MWPWSKKSSPLDCPLCHGRLTRVVSYSFCGQCGWNAEAIRKRASKTLLPMMVWLPLWVAFARYLVQAPWWFIALGVATSLWGLGQSAYVLSVVPNLPRPLLANVTKSPVFDRPRFSTTGVTMTNIVDLLVGGIFIVVAGSIISSQRERCAEDISKWKQLDFQELGLCFVPWVFLVVGASLIINNWRERKKESTLTSAGYLVSAIVVAIENQGKNGTSASYEFVAPNGEVLSGQCTINDGEIEEGGAILILVDPADAKNHRAVPSLRFYELEHTPIIFTK